MPESDHFFGLGDKPSNKRTKSRAPYFAPPVPLPPDLEQRPKPTPRERKKLAQVEQMEKASTVRAKLDALARTVNGALSNFESESQRGSLEASAYLFLIAYRSIRALEKAYSTRPDAIRHLAAQQIIWPAMVSTKRQITELSVGNIKKLDLGKSIGINLNNTRWNLGNLYSKNAFGLITRLIAIKAASELLQMIDAERDLKGARLSNKLILSLGKHDAAFIADMRKLPKLRKATISAYRPLLKRMFFAVTPKPEEMECYSNTAMNPNRKSVAEKREKIFDQVMQGLSSMLLP